MTTTTGIDLEGLIADGHLDLDAIFRRAEWWRVETIASYTAWVYGDDGDGTRGAGDAVPRGLDFGGGGG